MTLPMTRTRGVMGAVIIALGGCGDEPTKPRVGVASVEITPEWVRLEAGRTVQLTATLKDAAGHALLGRPVLWTTSSAAKVTVAPNGLVQALAMGTATIRATSEGQSDTAALVVTAPPAVACLYQAGTLISVSGVQTAFHDTSLADNAKVDASTAQFVTTAAIPIRVGGGANACFHGGVVIGQHPPSTSWLAMHETYGMVVKRASGFKIDNLRVFNYGDGPAFDAGAVDDWSIRGAHLKYLRDDCLENDFLNSGTIEDAFLDGCYGGVSARPYTTTPDGSANLVVVRHALIRLQAMDGAYAGTLPNHNGFWKWHPSGPKLALYHSVFRADAPSREGADAGSHLAPPPDKLADCEDNVMVWLGAGAFPEPLPTTFNGKPCFRVLTGGEGLAHWNEAAARWLAAHPATAVDAGAP